MSLISKIKIKKFQIGLPAAFLIFLFLTLAFPGWLGGEPVPGGWFYLTNAEYLLYLISYPGELILKSFPIEIATVPFILVYLLILFVVGLFIDKRINKIRSRN